MPDKHWMQYAFNLALRAKSEGEVPVGAVLVSRNGVIIGSGWNQVIKNNDPTAHAELLAIKDATSNSKNYRLDGSTLYVTLEPCCMCAGAMVHARIQRLVFAARDFKAGAAGSVYNLLRGKPLNHQVQIDEGVLYEQCSSLLSDFFKVLR